MRTSTINLTSIRSISRGKFVAHGLIIVVIFVGYVIVVLYSNTSRRALTTECDQKTGTTQVSYDKARYDSYGFFDDIDESDWSELQRRAHSESIFHYPRSPNNGIEDTARWMINNVDPIFTCQHMRRVGGMGDGGKWTCDPHRLSKHDDCLIYSVGSAGKYEFEDGLVALLGKHCEIHVFDPNPRFRRVNDTEKKNIFYHAVGLKSSNGPSGEFGNGAYSFATLTDMMQELNHTQRRIDVFKVDCEGCEWASYNDWLDKAVDIRQILIETHPSSALKQNLSVASMFAALVENGFVPFSKEANTHPAAKPPGTLFEYGFVRLRPTFLEK